MRAAPPFHFILHSAAFRSQSWKSQGNRSNAFSEFASMALASFNDCEASAAFRVRSVCCLLVAGPGTDSALLRDSSRGATALLASSTTLCSFRRCSSQMEGNAPHIGPELSSRRRSPPRVRIPLGGDFPPMTSLRAGASRSTVAHAFQFAIRASSATPSGPVIAAPPRPSPSARRVLAIPLSSVSGIPAICRPVEMRSE